MTSIDDPAAPWLAHFQHACPPAAALSARRAHCGADEVHVALGQAVGLLAVANGRKVVSIELRKAEKLKDFVRDCEPVP